MDYRNKADNSIYYNDFDGSVLVIVPHEDDEVLVAGNMLAMFTDRIDVNIAFLTNGDYFFSGDIRIRESTAALSRYFNGKNTNKIFVLGYPDSGNVKNNNILFDEDNVSKKVTHGNKYIEDYSFYEDERHKTYNFTNVVEDIASLLVKIKPHYIVCNACDRHLDHVLLSIALDRAVGIVINNDLNYSPIVLKKYAYDFGYILPRDYYECINIKNTPSTSEFINQKSQMHMLGKYEYVWDERIRFPTAKNNQKKLLTQTMTYKALRCFKSQRNNYSILSLINGDDVFLMRRSDSLCYAARIKVSSGNPDLLRDFQLYDWNFAWEKTDNSDQLWHPSKYDLEREIEYCWPDDVCVKKIVIYGVYESLNKKEPEITIYADGHTIYTGPFGLNNGKLIISFDEDVHAKTLQIRFPEFLEKEGVSEIEIFDSEYVHHSKGDSLFDYIKILVNGEFAYKYYYHEKEEIVLSIYQPISNLNYVLQVVSGDADIIDSKLVIFNHKNPVVVKAMGLNGIWDQIVFSRATSLFRLRYHLNKWLDEMLLHFDHFNSSIYYKIIWGITLVKRKVSYLLVKNDLRRQK